MEVTDDVQALADACEAAAHQIVSVQISLGPRPSTSPADLSWDQTSRRLKAQLDNLTSLASGLAADAVVAGLSAHAAEVKQLGEVSAGAEAEIAQIADVAKLLTKISRLLDVGTSLLALATAPSSTAVETLIKAMMALSANE